MAAAERKGGAVKALPTPGQVIGGKYEIVRVMGEGGMGVVFEATHLKLRQRVAVKMLLPDMLSHDIIVTRFEREARASGQLRNRHTVRVMDVDVTADGLPYMVMEYLEGHDLQTELDLRERLPLAEAAQYVLQACSAMIEAHQLGIVHRDLKPANLFLALESASDASSARTVKVLDFGISKVQAEGDVKLTVAETVIGTAMYMSPEQIRSSGEVDARTDIWALGIILFELLAGRPPFLGSPTQLAAMIVSEDAPDVRTYAADVPAEISAIIRKALTRDPQMRFEDVTQLAWALAPYSPTGTAGIPSSSPRLPQSGGGPPLVSLRASHPALLEDANTILQAPAVSEARVGRSGSGTTPGWAQSGQPAARSRTLLIGFVAAFVLGLIVVGGAATVWVRTHPPATPIAAGGAVPDGAVAAASASAEPVPPAIESTTTPAVASAGAAAVDSAARRTRVPPHAPTTTTTTTTTTAPRKPVAPTPAAAPTGNPIHL